MTATLTQASLGVSIVKSFQFAVVIKDECLTTNLIFSPQLFDMTAIVGDSLTDQTVTISDSVSDEKGIANFCGSYTTSKWFDPSGLPPAVSYDSSTLKFSLSATDQTKVGVWTTSVRIGLSEPFYT